MPARVMVVDDDRELLEVVQEGLERGGFEVFTFNTVPEARAALKERKFDVVVTDLALSDTGGLALCEELARDFPEIVIVVMTGHSDADAAARALGASEVLIKPVRLAHLTDTLKRLLAAP